MGRISDEIFYKIIEETEEMSELGNQDSQQGKDQCYRQQDTSSS